MVREGSSHGIIQGDTSNKVASLMQRPFTWGAQEGDFVMSNFIKLLNDEAGASAAEYALILAIVGSAIALAAIGLGNAISNRLSQSSTCIQSKTSSDYTANC
jgi:pilus assembly protein Flp/PilA